MSEEESNSEEESGSEEESRSEENDSEESGSEEDESEPSEEQAAPKKTIGKVAAKPSAKVEAESSSEKVGSRFCQC